MEKDSLEDQMKVLQNHFGKIVATIKHLKSSVDDLKMKYGEPKCDIEEILETQKAMKEVVVANSDTINKIKKEITEIKQSKKTNEEGNEENVKEKNEC